MRRLIAGLAATCLLLTACSAKTEAQKKRYNASFLDVFDTVTNIVGFADSESEFEETVQALHDDLLHYHRLFDIYNDYEGVPNLKTVNENAGVAPVKVDGEILDLLKDCKTYYDLTDGRVNVAMGSVLNLWHEARTEGINDPANATLPSQKALEEAAAHVSKEALILDEANSTVFLSDADARLDVGAIAKGWSVQRVCENAPAGLLISVGGNVCATGPKDEQGSAWVVGVQNPDMGQDYLHTLYLTKGSVVTSGDYQRGYLVDGNYYHHIIDPDTLYPSTYWRSVTVVCPDSGVADALSTALFVLSQEEGQALLDKTDAKAMWLDGAGNRFYSPGFEDLIRT